MTRTAAILRCGDAVRHVWPTIASLQRQTVDATEIVLVIDDSTPESARPWLVEMARTVDLLLVDAAPRFTSGALYNAGLRAATADFVLCVEAGDLVDPRFCEAAADVLTNQSDIAIVSSSLRLVGLRSDADTVPLPAVDLGTLVGATTAIHRASMFRRGDWAAVGGFDDQLPSLAHYEFWLRLLASGRRCASVDRWLTRAEGSASHSRDSDKQGPDDAIETIVAKHKRVFAQYAVEALCQRERELQALSAQHRRLVAVRDSGVQELADLEARARLLHAAWPELAAEVDDFRSLRRISPKSRNWGYERGQPVDRYYIDQFMESHATDIAGVVLEVKDPGYTHRFGGPRVTRSDVVDLDTTNAHATTVSDLRFAANIPSDEYDCLILTQTLQYVDEIDAAMAECFRILKPGGVLLATLPCTSRLGVEYGANGDFWRVTKAGARQLFQRGFSDGELEVHGYGSVLASTAFLYGLAANELTLEELEHNDPAFHLLIGVRVRKPARAASTSGGQRTIRARHRSAVGTERSAVLLYHRVADCTPDPHGLSVPPGLFRDQIAYLSSRYRVIPLDALVEAAQRDCLPPGAVAITFDDGYTDNLAAASSVLLEFGVPATFFITTERLDEEYEFWWDALGRLLLHARSGIPGELTLELPHGRRILGTATEEDRVAAYWTIYHALVGQSAADISATIERVALWAGWLSGPDPADSRMNIDKLRQLASRQGHAIGAHSIRHEMLPCRAPAIQRDEVSRSRDVLETALGADVTAFSYPFGAWSSETVEAVHDASMKIAVTCGDVPFGPDVHPLRVPRLVVTPRRALNFPKWLRMTLGEAATG